MEQIKNYKVYTDGMKTTLLDKIFFIDKVDANVFVDFGCADGTMLDYLHDMFPNHTYIGYDISEEMIKLAKSNTSKDITYVTKLDELKSILENVSGTKCIVLNSVIHEIYSYSSAKEIDDFYSFIFSELFDYIAVRDMMPEKHIDHPSNDNDVALVYSALRRGLEKTTPSMLTDFENQWGSIKNNKNLIHFLLKYRYKENWKREVRENYFPVYVDEFVSHMPLNWCIDYEEEFLLPYLKRKVYEDFQISIKENTHTKLVFRKFK